MSTIDSNDNAQMLADSARKYVERGYSEVQRAISSQHPDGCHPGRWQEFADLGWLALPLAESCGGLGGSLSDACALAEELGRGLVVEPLTTSTVLAGWLLQESTSKGEPSDLLSQLADGSIRIAFAPWEAQSRYDATDLQTRAESGPHGWLLQGAKSLALGIAGADMLIVAALTGPGRRGLFLLASDTNGLEITPRVLYDGRHAASLRLNSTPAKLLIEGIDEDINTLVTRALDRTIIAHCAETVGAMVKAFEITRDHVGTRKQFGKAIASNQTIQHRLVDLYVEIEETRALVRAAAASAGSTGVPSPHMTAAAAACMAQVSRHVWEEAIQLHGAIGMTEEYVIGAYVQRLALAGSIYGHIHHHLERLAAQSLGEIS